MAPKLVAGHVQGGIAQGFGQAVTVNAVYDSSVEVLTCSFMDYAMRRAADLPFFAIYDEAVPTKANPLGMTGCGKAGAFGALQAISNAVCDALAPAGGTRVDVPFSPHRIWHGLQEARAVAD